MSIPSGVRTAVTQFVQISSLRAHSPVPRASTPGAGGAGRPGVQRDERVDPHLERLVAGRADAVHVGDRRRVRERRAAAVDPRVLPVEQREERAARRRGVRADARPGLVADGHERHAGRPGEALLGAGDADVEPQSSGRSVSQPSDETTSAITSAPWRFAIGPISATGFIVPDGVSEWTTASSSASGCAANALDHLRLDLRVVGHLDLDDVALYSASQRPNHLP